MRFPCILLLASCFASPVLATALGDIDDFDAGRADIVLLGEVHDNPHHHRNQAAALERIAPSAVVYEMLTPAQADIVNSADRSDREALEEALDWKHAGWPDFAMYHELMLATDAPVYGAAIPREDLIAAMQTSAAEMFGEDAADFGLGPLPADEQAEREALQMAAHCDALPEEMLPGMVEAQRLRDARFSATALRALDETGGPVAVITGNGHARTDWGMPVYLAAARPDAALVSLGQFELEAGDHPHHDVWIVTPAAEREDPCAVFDKR